MEGGKWSTGDLEGAVTVSGPSWVEPPEDQEAGRTVPRSGRSAGICSAAPAVTAETGGTCRAS